MSEVKNNPRYREEMLIVITSEVTSTPYFSASQNMKFSSVNNTSVYGKALVFKHPAPMNAQCMTSDSVTALV
jgi:hypothetical protein